MTRILRRLDDVWPAVLLAPSAIAVLALLVRVLLNALVCLLGGLVAKR